MSLGLYPLLFLPYHQLGPGNGWRSNNLGVKLHKRWTILQDSEPRQLPEITEITGARTAFPSARLGVSISYVI